MPVDIKVIYVTCDTLAHAEALSRTLIEERLIACANIIPGLKSLYRWEDKIMEESEVAIIMKTSITKVKEAVARISALHTYDVPAVEVWDVADAPAPFQEWVNKETG